MCHFLNGDVLTGISTFFIDKNLDTGPIILQKKIPIVDEDTYDLLSDKMAEYGIGLIMESLDLLDGNEFIPVPQVKTKVSYAPKIPNKMFEIDWSFSAIKIKNYTYFFRPNMLKDVQFFPCTVIPRFWRFFGPSKTSPNSKSPKSRLYMINI